MQKGEGTSLFHMIFLNFKWDKEILVRGPRYTVQGVAGLCTHTYIYRPRGKESTKVQISQNKGKESENSYQKLKRSL